MSRNAKADLVHAACATAAAVVAGVAVTSLVTYLKPASFITSLQDKHVLVTGGSSGIGLEIARQALAEGASVSILARNETNLAIARTALLKSSQCSPEKIFVKAVDVGDGLAITAAIQEAFCWKPIDVLVCNAGIAIVAPFQDFTLGQIEEIIRVNLLGSAYTAHAAIPLMIPRSASHPSSIVFINSLAALWPLYKSLPYCASKYGQRGIADVLKLELLAHNIRVTVVYPGYTVTPMLDVAHAQDKETQDIQGFTNYVNESAQDVATCTLNAVKRGQYHVLTRPRLKNLSQFARGTTPPDTFWEAFMETVTYIPCRLLGYLAYLNKVKLVRKYETKRQQAGAS